MGWEVPALSEAPVRSMKTKDRIERERRRRMLKEAESRSECADSIKEHDRRDGAIGLSAWRISP